MPVFWCLTFHILATLNNQDGSESVDIIPVEVVSNHLDPTAIVEEDRCCFLFSSPISSDREVAMRRSSAEVRDPP